MAFSKYTVSQAGGLIELNSGTFFDFADNNQGTAQDYGNLIIDFRKAFGFDHTVDMDIYRKSKATHAMQVFLYDNPRRKNYGEGVIYTVKTDEPTFDLAFRAKTPQGVLVKENDWTLGRFQTCLTVMLGKCLLQYNRGRKVYLLSPLTGAAFHNEMIPALLNSESNVNEMALYCSSAPNLGIVAKYDKKFVDPDIVAVHALNALSGTKMSLEQKKNAAKQIMTAQKVSGRAVQPTRVKDIWSYSRNKFDTGMLDTLLEMTKNVPRRVIETVIGNTVTQASPIVVTSEKQKSVIGPVTPIGGVSKTTGNAYADAYFAGNKNIVAEMTNDEIAAASGALLAQSRAVGRDTPEGARLKEAGENILKEADN